MNGTKGKEKAEKNQWWMERWKRGKEKGKGEDRRGEGRQELWEGVESKQA